jgi:hypothetical protein
VVDALVERWRSGLDGPSLAALGPVLRDANDLWTAAAAVAPPLVAIRRVAEERLGVPLLLTGSGATLVGLYPAPAAAVAGAAALADPPKGMPAGVHTIATATEGSPTTKGEGS